MDVHKTQSESGISGEVRAVFSVSHLQAFCNHGFSDRHPFDDCVVQIYLFLGVFEVQFIQHHFLNVGRCNDSLRTEWSGIESRWRRNFFRISPDRPWGPT